ncbi:hypothetical protein H6F89_18285 [Cyanobacteria bacterium FACHB-63]|nr:hypothetical protein [Cyanobacteria bacterium FACHB-63]
MKIRQTRNFLSVLGRRCNSTFVRLEKHDRTQSLLAIKTNADFAKLSSVWQQNARSRWGKGCRI